MKTTTHKSALNKATRFAAMGTTLYTLFVPLLQVTFYDKIAWLNFSTECVTNADNRTLKHAIGCHFVM